MQRAGTTTERVAGGGCTGQGELSKAELSLQATAWASHTPCASSSRLWEDSTQCQNEATENRPNQNLKLMPLPQVLSRLCKSDLKWKLLTYGLMNGRRVCRYIGLVLPVPAQCQLLHHSRMDKLHEKYASSEQGPFLSAAFWHSIRNMVKCNHRLPRHSITQFWQQHPYSLDLQPQRQKAGVTLGLFSWPCASIVTFCLLCIKLSAHMRPAHTVVLHTKLSNRRDRRASRGLPHTAQLGHPQCSAHSPKITSEPSC